MLQVHNDKVPIEDQHGTLCVAGSGVSLWSVIWHYNQGDTAKEIADAFPTLNLADVHLVIGYFLRHEDEVKAHLEAEQREADALRDKIEVELPTDDLREQVVRHRRKHEQGDT